MLGFPTLNFLKKSYVLRFTVCAAKLMGFNKFIVPLSQSCSAAIKMAVIGQLRNSRNVFLIVSETGGSKIRLQVNSVSKVTYCPLQRQFSFPVSSHGREPGVGSLVKKCCSHE